MRILFAGDQWYGSNARSLAEGFRQAGHEVAVVDTTAVTLPVRGGPAWWYAKVAGRRSPRAVERVHVELAAAADALSPDLLLSFNGMHLDQERLLNLPATWHVHYSPDDVSNPTNTTAAYLAHESQWDAVVTTKAHNVRELVERGARNVIFVLSAYDPHWHRPTTPATNTRFSAGFVGNARPDRVELITELARRHGDRFLVSGPGWRRYPMLALSGAVVRGPRYGIELSATIASIDANLVLLNSDNRDTHTCRTFEVPAAGGLFVGPRTVEHQQLLADGVEALLYEDTAELHEQLTRVRADPAAAAAMARRGHEAITQGGNTYRDRAREIIDALD